MNCILVPLCAYNGRKIVLDLNKISTWDKRIVVGFVYSSAVPLLLITQTQLLNCAQSSPGRMLLRFCEIVTTRSCSLLIHPTKNKFHILDGAARCFMSLQHCHCYSSILRSPRLDEMLLVDKSTDSDKHLNIPLKVFSGIFNPPYWT